MSDTQMGPGWHQASDGRWYPEESQHSKSMPPPQVGPSSSRLGWGLSGTLMGFQLAMAALALMSAVAMIFALDQFEEIMGTSRYLDPTEKIDDWKDIYQIAEAGTVFYLFAGIVVFTLSIIWANMSYRAVERDGRRWASGWTIGAWFIPLANNLLVPMVLAETATYSCWDKQSSHVDHKKRRPIMIFLVLWWSTYAAGTLIWWSGVSNAESATTESGSRVAHWAAVVGGSLTTLSLVCAALYIYRQTAQIVARSKAASRPLNS